MNKTFKKILIALGVSFAFMLGYALIQIMVSLAFTLVYSMTAVGADLSDISGATLTEKVMNFTMQKVLENTGVILLISGAISIAAMLLIILLLKKHNKWDMAKILAVPYKVPAAIFTGLLCFATGVAFNVGFVNLMSLIPIPESWIEANNESVGAVLSGNIWVAIIATSVIAPVAEELIFRGVFYNMLKDALPLRRRLAALISGFTVSVFFGIYHGNILQGLYTFLFSILLVIIYERTGSIWGPVLVHAGFNSSWILELFAARIFEEKNAAVNGAIFIGVALVLLGGLFLLTKYCKQNAADGNYNDGSRSDNYYFN